MMHLWRCLGAEFIKLKRTLALAMVFLAPAVVLLLQLALYLGRAEIFLRPDTNPWELMQSVIGLWSVLMLPLFITLESALIAGLEHGNDQWKHLHALPVPRGAYFAAKLFTNVALVGGSLLILGAGIQITGFILHLCAPEMASGPLLWADLGRRLLFTFFASWLAIAIHAWLSQRFASFTVAVGAGMAATVAGFVAANSQRLVAFYPWTLPINAMRPETALLPIALYSVLGSILVAVAGGLHLARRDVP